MKQSKCAVTETRYPVERGKKNNFETSRRSRDTQISRVHADSMTPTKLAVTGN